MTSRDVYFKTYVEYELPIINMIYFCMENGYIQVGKHISLILKEDLHESNILRMEEVEKTEGFMYWLNTPEGEDMANQVSNAMAEGARNYFRDHPE